MKKFSVLLTLAVLMVSSSVFAGSLDYLSNQSAKYCMNTAATARTDGADIVAYNPAGTALMGQGFFIDVSNQTLFKPYKQEVDYTKNTFGAATTDWSDEYKQDEPTILLPNVFLVYNAGTVGIGNLAVYGQAGVVAGGGSLEWDGLAAVLTTAEAIDLAVGAAPLTKIDMTAKGSSVYFGFGAGVAYSFLDNMLAISAGARYTMAQRSAEMTGTIVYANSTLTTATIDSKHDYDASGITPIFGLDIKPMKELTIGVRYEMETELEFEYKKKANSVSFPANAGLANLLTSTLDKDGVKDNANLPQILSIGVEYAINPELTVGLSSNIYFIGDAKNEVTVKSLIGTADTPSVYTEVIDYNKYFGTGYEIAVGASYKVMPELKVAASIMYTDQAAKDDLYTDQKVLNNVSSNPVLDSIFMGLGATYTVIPNLDLTLALAWVHYLPKEADVPTYVVPTTTPVQIGTTSVKYSKDIYNIALGASYKI